MNVLENKERKAYAKWIIDNYVYSIMGTDAYPPKALALFYSRVYPHFEDKISEARTSSPSWAFAHMKDNQVEDLVNETQDYVQMRYTKVQSITWRS